MTLRRSPVCQAPRPAWTRTLTVTLSLILASVAGIALAGTAQDGFGEAVAAYRAGSHGKALEGWRSLADEGNPLAQYNVGLLHYQGRGTTRSYAQALIWFHAAARQGLASSYLRLGAMFERGEGVPRDFEQAYLWYTLAVSAFGPGPCRDTALDRRRVLAESLTEAQVLKVLAESSEWAPGPLGGVGQPCFRSIAVRPVDGAEDASPVTATAEPAAAAEKPGVAPEQPKTALGGVAAAKPEAQEPATVASALMSKLPAKMPGGKGRSGVSGAASAAPRDEADAKFAEPLPTVDVPERRVHTVKTPGTGTVPLVGTTPRETTPPKGRAVALAPAAQPEPRDSRPPAVAPPSEARETVTPRPAARTGAAVQETPAPGAKTPSATGSHDASPDPASSGRAARSRTVARAAPPAPRRATRPHGSREESGVYVQLGALSTQKMAYEVWRRLRSRNGDIFGGRQRKLEKTQVKGGKVLYRLYAGPFVSDGKADAFCDTLKRRDEPCFVPPKFRRKK